MLAEIGDKMPSLPLIWSISTIWAVFCLCISLWNRLAGLVLVPFVGWITWSMAFELRSFHDLILSELGSSYLLQNYTAAFLPIFAIGMGFLSRTSRRGQPSI